MAKILCIMMALLMPQEDLALPPADTWTASDTHFVMVSGVFEPIFEGPVLGREGPEYWFRVWTCDTMGGERRPVLCIARERRLIKLCKVLSRAFYREVSSARVMANGGLIRVYYDSMTHNNVVLVEEMARLP